MTADERRRLIEENLRLAYWHARNMHRRHRYLHRVPYEDVVAAALLGLCRAAATYDPARGKFSTYAIYAIRTSVQLEGLQVGLVRLPTHFTSSRRAKVSAHCREAASKIEKQRSWLSYSAMPGQPLAPEVDLDAAIDHAERLAIVLDALDRIPPRLARIVRRVYLEDRIMADVAQEESCSKQRIQQLVNKGLRAVRKVLGVEGER